MSKRIYLTTKLRINVATPLSALHLLLKYDIEIPGVLADLSTTLHDETLLQDLFEVSSSNF